MAGIDYDDIASPGNDDEPGPRWLVAVGILMLVGLMAIAAFSLGVYVAERGLLH